MITKWSKAHLRLNVHLSSSRFWINPIDSSEGKFVICQRPVFNWVLWRPYHPRLTSSIQLKSFDWGVIYIVLLLQLHGYSWLLTDIRFVITLVRLQHEIQPTQPGTENNKKVKQEYNGEQQQTHIWITAYKMSMLDGHWSIVINNTTDWMILNHPIYFTTSSPDKRLK